MPPRQLLCSRATTSLRQYRIYEKQTARGLRTSNADGQQVEVHDGHNPIDGFNIPSFDLDGDLKSSNLFSLLYRSSKWDKNDV